MSRLLGAILSVIMLPAQLLKRVQQHTDVDKVVELFLNRRRNEARRISFHAGSGIRIDGLLWHVPGANNRWLVALNANGALYEQQLTTLARYARQLRRSLLLFNYRGCGGSSASRVCMHLNVRSRGL